MSVLKALLEKQVAAFSNAGVPNDEAGDAGDIKKRYLILISTVMTWGMTKPLDPVSILELIILLVDPANVPPVKAMSHFM